MFIRVNINNEANNTIVKERNEIDNSIIHDILSKRKMKLNELNIDICYNSWIFIIVN